MGTLGPEAAVVIAEVFLREAGPIGAKDEQEAHYMAALAIRRWNSYDRRRKGKKADEAARVEDLAKGLRDHYEPDRHLVGPMMTEYRWVASAVAGAIASL